MVTVAHFIFSMQTLFFSVSCEVYRVCMNDVIAPLQYIILHTHTHVFEQSRHNFLHLMFFLFTLVRLRERESLITLLIWRYLTLYDEIAEAILNYNLKWENHTKLPTHMLARPFDTQIYQFKQIRILYLYNAKNGNKT